MNLKEKFLEKKNQFSNYLTDPKVVRRCIIAAEIFFPAMIIMGVLVAVFFGPGNYNIMDNYISDMGSHRYTPIPKFLDDGAMITAILLVPVCFYLKKMLDLKSKQLESINISPKYSGLVLVTFLIGLIGFFGIGFFSEDVAISLYPHTTSVYDLHEILTVVQFIGIASAGLLIGIIFVRYPQGIIDITGYERMSKLFTIIMGLIMIFLTPILCAFFLLELPPSIPFWEWMLFFSIFGWILPLGVAVLHQIKTEELK
jgi:hypothetical protein